MQNGRLVMALSLLAVPVGDARASGPMLVIVQPADRSLFFSRAPYDQPSATQRVLILNDGDPVGFEDIRVGPPFEVVATGGDLGTGHVKFWDIACRPVTPGEVSNSSYMDIDVCGASCDDEWRDFIWLDCLPGLLEGPENDLLVATYAYTSIREVVSFTNPGPDPLTVTSLATNDPVFSAAPAGDPLPVTLAAGDHIDVVVTVTPTGSGDVVGVVDVVAGTVIAGRARLLATTVSQIAAPVSAVQAPLGARYSMPIMIRNSYPSARTIAGVASTVPGDVVIGLAGVELAPAEVARGLVTFTVDQLGFNTHTLMVDFDAGQDDIGPFSAYGVPATFAVSTDDAAPSDGLVDFGVRKVGSAPVEQTFTITNLTAVDEPIAGCWAPGAPFELVGACPSLLPASGSVQLTVRIVPAAPGVFADIASLNVANLYVISGLMSAQVVASQVTFSTAALAFPDTPVAMAAQRSTTITNVADNPITLPVIVAGAGFSAAAAEVTVPGRASAEVVVEFAPSSAGMFAGTLEIGTAGDLDHAIIALSGAGTAVSQPPPDGGTGGGTGDGGMPAPDDTPDGGTAGGPGHGGGCRAGGGEGGLAIALLALIRHRRRYESVIKSSDAGHSAI